MTILLLQAQSVHDTVFVVQQEPGWQQWVQAFAAIAQIVLAIALLAVGLGVLFAAKRLKALMKKVEEQGQKLRIDLAPAIHNVTAVTENVNFVSKTVRKDAERLSESVNAATAKLKTAAEKAEERVGEFNALIGVVQEEAEALFIGGASTLRGIQAGADTFRRYQLGELEAGDDVYAEDEDDEYGVDDDLGEDPGDADEGDVEIEIRGRGRRGRGG
ncbi:MAG TPA: hypothetical protein VF092_07625 [Longimicrobium sp.]